MTLEQFVQRGQAAQRAVDSLTGRKPKKAELEQTVRDLALRLAEAERIGQQMSNCMFNLAQRETLKLDLRELEVFDTLRREWDARRKARNWNGRSYFWILK